MGKYKGENLKFSFDIKLLSAASDGFSKGWVITLHISLYWLDSSHSQSSTQLIDLGTSQECLEWAGIYREPEVWG
jgi:hypothetical protein